MATKKNNVASSINIGDKYPFLTYWMKAGINNFPKLVDDPDIFALFLVKHIERHPKEFKDRCLETFRKNSPTWQEAKPAHQKLMEEEVWETMIRPQLVNALLTRAIERHRDAISQQVTAAARKIKRGVGNINDIAEKLGRSLLSGYHTQGGSLFKSKGDLQIIKLIYEETCSAIKEIRQAIQVPCRRSQHEKKSWSYVEYYEQIRISFSHYKEILTDSELPLLTSKPSIPDCAVEIMYNRLGKFFPAGSSRDTLKDNLNRNK